MTYANEQHLRNVTFIIGGIIIEHKQHQIEEIVCNGLNEIYNENIYTKHHEHAAKWKDVE